MDEKRLFGRTTVLRAEHLGTDPQLELLLSVTDLGETYIGTGLTVVVGGFLIQGDLASARRHAEYLDEVLDKAMSEAAARRDPESNEGRAIEAWRKAMKEGFTRLEKARHAATEEVRKRYDASEDEEDVSDEQEGDEILAGRDRSVITLENAVLLQGPALAETKVGFVRIRIEQVAAWWLGRFG